MIENEPRRVQKMTPGLKPDDSSPSPAAINVVTHHRVPDRREMNANLMGSPGVQSRTQQVSRSKAGESDEVRPRLLATIDDCHTLSVSRVARNRLLHCHAVPIHVPPDHHGVPPADPSGGDRRAEVAV